VLDERAQFLAVEHRQALARIEDERHSRRGELRGVLEHALRPSGATMPSLMPAASLTWFRCECSSPRVKGGDLVVRPGRW
jgi:hypothetical protein